MLFPVGTERSLERIPVATIALIAVNVVLFIATVSSPEAMKILVLMPDDFHWWQIFTAWFMHGSICHLVGNMIFLWVFGTHCEDVLGIPLYLGLYFSAGLAADVLQVGMDVAFSGAMRGGLGASGCIMGLVALFATRFRRVKVRFFYWVYYIYTGIFRIDAIWVAGIYFAFDVLMALGVGAGWMMSGTGHFAHIGGFICGIVWAYALNLDEEAADDELDAEMTRMAASGSYTMAAMKAEEQLEKRPNDPDLHAKAARYYAMDRATPLRARQHWNQALKLWLRRGQVEKAVRQWQRLNYDHNPGAFDAEVILDLAVALDNYGQYSDAAELYASVAGREGAGDNAPLAAWRLAQMLRRVGSEEESRRWLQHILNTWPDSDEALEAQAALSR